MSVTEWSRALGESLLRQREDLWLTQESVCAAVGCSPSALSSWENGTASISHYRHQRLESFYRAERKARGTMAGTD